jgi:hypothetical protein
MGIAPINPVNSIGQCQYNQSASCYNPLPGDQSANGTGIIDTNSTDDEPVISPTVPTDPTNPNTPNPRVPESSWFQKNETWVIAVACVVFVAIIVTICYCMKQRKEDPYYGKTYSEEGKNPLREASLEELDGPDAE